MLGLRTPVNEIDPNVDGTPTSVIGPDVDGNRTGWTPPYNDSLAIRPPFSVVIVPSPLPAPRF